MIVLRKSLSLMLLLNAALLSITVPLCSAAYFYTGPATDELSKVKITISSPFEDTPKYGYAPIQVAISNQTQRERTWLFEFTTTQNWSRLDGNYSVIQELTVSGQSDSVFMITVPVNLQSHYGSGIVVKVSGHGIVSNQAYYSSPRQKSGYAPTGYLLMSKGLQKFHWQNLVDYYLEMVDATDAEVAKRKKSPFAPRKKQKVRVREIDLWGSAVDPDELPADWRCYSGVDCFWLTLDEWNRLPANVKSAIKFWVVDGGRLYLCGPNAKATVHRDFGLTVEGRTKLDLVSGVIHLVDKEIEELTPSDFAPSIDPRRPSPRPPVSTIYPGSWHLRSGLERREIQSGFIIGFMVLFAIIVGPVNLYGFTRKKRYRLFWTTPSLSVGASILLVLCILFKDGIGGDGRRAIAVCLLPNTEQAFIWQDQMSSTGVLGVQRFRASHDLFIKPISVKEGNSESIASVAYKDYNQSGDAYAGDWFQSRSEQVQYIKKVDSTRAKVEIMKGNGDRLKCRSSINGKVDRIFFVDEQNRYWHATDLSPGSLRDLQQTPEAEFREWYVSATSRMGPNVILKVNSATRQQQYFFATVTPADKPYIATLGSIDWVDEPVFFFGPVSAVESNPVTISR